MSIREQLTLDMRAAAARFAETVGAGTFLPPVVLQRPKDPAHGDYSLSFVLPLAKALKVAPST